MNRFGAFAASAALVAATVLAIPARAATIDLTTKGNWVGVYGKQGYILGDYDRVPHDGSGGINDNPVNPANDRKSLPAYVSSYSYSGGTQGYVWESNSTDLRDPQDPANPTGPRTAATTFSQGSYSMTFNLNAAAHFKLGVYALDWDNFGGRDVTLTVGADSQRVNNILQTDGYHQGEWVFFDVNAPSAGPLVLDIAFNAGANSNAVISGITFDGVPEPASFGVIGLGATGLMLRRRHR